MCGALPAPAGPAPSPIDIAPVVGVVEVDFRLGVEYFVLDSIVPLFPAIAAMQLTFKVIYARPKPRV